MKAFNSRKTPKEHWLFKEKHHTLSIMCKGGCTPYLFKTFLLEGEIIIRGQNRGRLECFNELCKIIKNSKGVPISYSIEYIEKIYNLKIKDVGLTRKDFSGYCKGECKNEKIIKRIIEYKEKNKKVEK